MAHAYKLCMHSLYAVLVVGSIHIGAITVTATVSSSNDSLSFVAFFFSCVVPLRTFELRKWVTFVLLGGNNSETALAVKLLAMIITFSAPGTYPFSYQFPFWITLARTRKAVARCVLNSLVRRELPRSWSWWTEIIHILKSTAYTFAVEGKYSVYLCDFLTAKKMET